MHTVVPLLHTTVVPPTSHNNHSNLSLLNSNIRSFILSLYLKQTNIECRWGCFYLTVKYFLGFPPHSDQYCEDLFYLFIYFATHKQHYKVLNKRRKEEE